MDSGKLWATGVSHLKPERRKKSNNDAATNGDLGASVIQNHVAWQGKKDTMDSGKLLWATGVSQLKRERRKKSNDDATTDWDSGA